MNETGMPMQWTDQQWSRVQQVVHDEARKTRIAARFLPLFGPLPADTITVPKQNVEVSGDGLHVEDTDVLRLITLSVNVHLKTTQHSDPELSSAMTAFRRAANMIARAEDAIIFLGGNHQGFQGVKESHDVPDGGLVQAGAGRSVEFEASGSPGDVGQRLIHAVGQAITKLDSDGYNPPYALALGNKLFVGAETPNASSLVLPSDRIRPLIEGPLVHSAVLDDETGVLVSLSGNPVEIVVASDIHVRFLQVTLEPTYVYRVSERIVLRIKEPQAIVTFAAKAGLSAKQESPKTERGARG